MQGLAGFKLLAPWADKARRTTNAAAGVGFAIDVPFEFVIGTYSLSAGNYRFEALRSPTPGVCVLAVRGDDGRVHKLAVSTSSVRSHESSRSKLIFHRRETRHFLTEAWIEGRCLNLDSIAPCRTSIRCRKAPKPKSSCWSSRTISAVQFM